MTPLPTDELSKGERQTMKDWLENYRPVRQRTMDNAIQRIAWFVFATLIHWITIYLVDRVIQPSNNWGQVEEYESDSDDIDNDVDIESEELVIGKPIMTRSGRQVKVWIRFDA